MRQRKATVRRRRAGRKCQTCKPILGRVDVVSQLDAVLRISGGMLVIRRGTSLLMAERNDKVDDENPRDSRGVAKKPYQEPAFRYERVFETMALSCGKVNATEFQCRFHRMSS